METCFLLNNNFVYALLRVSEHFLLNVRPLHRYINQIRQAEEKDTTENSPGCSCFPSAVPSLSLGIKVLDPIFCTPVFIWIQHIFLIMMMGEIPLHNSPHCSETKSDIHYTKNMSV